jgi:hypothetical protein
MEIAGIILLATLIEGLITYLFGEEGEGRTYLKYVSLALGIGASVAYQVDIPAMVGLTASYSIIGYVVSGLIIGRGANYLNDILGLVQSKR